MSDEVNKLPDFEKLTLDTPEVAKLLGIGQRQAYMMMASATLPSFRIGRRLLISRKALEQWVEQQGGKEKPVPVEPQPIRRIR